MMMMMMMVVVLQLNGLEDVKDVQGVPTFKFFKDGKLVETIVGADDGKLKASVAKLK